MASDLTKRAVAIDVTHRTGYRIMAYPAPSDFTPVAEHQLIQKALRLISFFKKRPRGSILLPGGLVNGALIYSDLAARFGFTCATFDSGPQSLLLSIDGIASHQPDNAKTYAKILAAPKTERDFAVATARDIRIKRESKGDDVFTVKFDSADLESYDLLLGMSFEADTAALGLDYIFDDVRDWLESTVRELNTRRPGIRIVVRQHPDERLFLSPQNVEALDHLTKLYKSIGANVTIVDAFSNVSTYELARRSRAVVVGSTTFGIEAAMLGLPVIVFRNSYYAETDFVQRPTDRSDYFRLIEESLDGAHMPNADQQDHAHLMYYVLEACNRIRLNLTPQPVDFLDWLEDKPLEIFHDGDFKMIIDALATKSPFSLRKHEERWANQNAIV